MKEILSGVIILLMILLGASAVKPLNQEAASSPVVSILTKTPDISPGCRTCSLLHLQLSWQLLMSPR